MHSRNLVCLAILCSALWTPACSFPPKHEYQMAPGQAYSQELGSALLLPINETEKPTQGLEKGEKGVFALITEYLEAQGLEVETLELAQYRKAARDAAEAARRQMRSGESSVAREVRFADTVSHIAKAVGSDAALVIVPNMVMRAGEMGGRSLRWDGVRRKIKGTTNWTMSGNTTAASLHVAIYKGDGSLLFKGYGGLDILWAMNAQKRRMELITDRLEDHDNLAEGICVAFYPYFGAEQTCY